MRATIGAALPVLNYVNADKLLSFWERELAQVDRVENAEDGDTRAKPTRQNDNRAKRKIWRLAQRAHRTSQVAVDRVQTPHELWEHVPLRCVHQAANDKGAALRVGTPFDC